MTLDTVTDYDIQALIDNELNHEEAKEVFGHLEKNRSAYKRYKELMAQKNLLKLWWRSQQLS